MHHYDTYIIAYYRLITSAFSKQDSKVASALIAHSSLIIAHKRSFENALLYLTLLTPTAAVTIPNLETIKGYIHNKQMNTVNQNNSEMRTSLLKTILLDELHWLDVPERIEYKLGVTVYRSLGGMYALYRVPSSFFL